MNIEDADEGPKTAETNESEEKKAGAIDNDDTAETKEKEKKKKEFPLMDMLSSFLYEEKEPLPILCGYFSKIMEQMLDKQK